MNTNQFNGVTAILLMDGWHVVERLQPHTIANWFWCREYLGSGWFELEGPMESILATRKKSNG